MKHANFGELLEGQSILALLSSPEAKPDRKKDKKWARCQVVKIKNDKDKMRIHVRHSSIPPTNQAN